VADLLGSLERASASEDGQASEEPLLLVQEEVVAPLDRRPQRALALGRIAGATGQERQALVEALEHLGRGHRLYACSRELERERQIVEAGADLGDSFVGVEVRSHCPRSRQEEADALLVDERGNRVLLLAREL
jgi:hypothetical protein